MIEHDTIRLLRECDAGVKMGIGSIDQVTKHVSNNEMRDMLEKSKSTHERLDAEIQAELARFHDDGKDPNPIAKGMSWLKTGVMLTMNESDKTIADLMTDGCNMGVKSLSCYLNKYKAADESSKDIAKRLIKAESMLAEGMRSYL
jgi:hypothetical protein